MNEFHPLNELETALLSARRNEIPFTVFMQQVLDSELALPTVKEVHANGSGFAPILYDRNSVPMLAAFTDKQRILEVPDLSKFCLLMKGLEVLRRIPRGHGLVVNPGLAVGFDVSPEGIEKIVKDMG